MPLYLTPKDIERFWSKVGPRNPEGCWVWVRAVKRSTYGAFRLNGSLLGAHRIAWEMENGPIPDGLYVCHACDNSACVRNDGPNSHLFLGTPTDNIHDSLRKGRWITGDRNGSHTHPERMPRGDNNWSRQHPELNVSRLHPEIMPRGESHGMSKLTEVQIREIRSRYAAGGISQKALGREYGVVQSLIGMIVLNQIWKHIT